MRFLQKRFFKESRVAFRRPSSSAQAARQGWLTQGFVNQYLDKAFAEACRRGGLTSIGDTLSAFPGKSVGGLVTDDDGKQGWLKVRGVLPGHQTAATMIGRERQAPVVPGVARPDILDCFEWSEAGGVRWHALLMSQVASPAILGDAGWQEVTDACLAALKNQLAALGKAHAPHFAYRPEEVRYAILNHFGSRAPHEASEWHLAHGDVTWRNLTAPELCLLDWERWGEAPKGYDIGYLMVHSADRPNLVARLEAAFAQELSTPSGTVGLLFACAVMLNRLDIHSEGRDFRRAVEDIARRALER